MECQRGPPTVETAVPESITPGTTSSRYAIPCWFPAGHPERGQAIDILTRSPRILSRGNSKSSHGHISGLSWSVLTHPRHALSCQKIRTMQDVALSKESIQSYVPWMLSHCGARSALPKREPELQVIVTHVTHKRRNKVGWRMAYVPLTVVSWLRQFP